MRNDPLARNIAEVIADLFHRHAPPRDQESLLALVQYQIEHVQRVTAKPLNAEIERLGKEAERAAEKIERLDGEVLQLLEEVEQLRAVETTAAPPGRAVRPI